MSTGREILGMKAADAEPPKPFPTGTYKAQVKGQHSLGQTRGENQTPFVRFQFQPTEPMGDVDQEELPENWNERALRNDFFLTEDAAFMLKDFATAAGVKLGNRSFEDILPELPGKEVIIQVKLNPPRNENGRPFNTIERITSVED